MMIEIFEAKRLIKKRIEICGNNTTNNHIFYHFDSDVSIIINYIIVQC